MKKMILNKKKVAQLNDTQLEKLGGGNGRVFCETATCTCAPVPPGGSHSCQSCILCSSI